MAFVLQLFGGFRLVGEHSRQISLPDRARALLAYLAVAASPVPRQVLAELLSGEGSEQEQRATLRQAVYVLRKAMADGAVICTQQDDLVLNGGPVSADVRRFQSAIARDNDHSLAEAVELYRGPFLEGERSPSLAFEEWLGARRAEFLDITLLALLKLARSDSAAGLYASALARARRALTLDPLREDAHRQVMRSLAAMGQRSNALRQYEVARQVLADELDVAPEVDTETLREAIARGAGPSFSDSAVPPVSRETSEGCPAADEAGVADRAGIMTCYRTALVQTATRFFAGQGRSPAVKLRLLVFAMTSLLILGAGLSWLARAPPVASPQAALAPDPSAVATPRLSIIVLPFANLSGNPDQEYFADGITDDLTSDLSRIDGSFVISRHTAFTYKGKDGIDVREVGRDLGIRYVLEGSVRQAGDRVHINAELIDAATAAQIWADRFEGSRGDLPAFHSEVTGRIAATLRLELTEAEARRVEQENRLDPVAADDALRGWAILYRPYSRENRTEARRLFERALVKDPNTVSALIGLAHVLEGYSTSPAEDRRRADALLRRALDLDPNRAATYFVLGMLRRSQGRLSEAVEAYQTAITLDHNYARAYLYLGWTAMLLGRSEEAIVLAQRAMRLNPRDPNIADYFYLIGSAQTLLDRADEAIASLERARTSNPRLWYIHLHLAAAYGLAQRNDEAKRVLAEALRLRPEITSLAKIKAAFPQINNQVYLAQAERTIFLGLRRAGLPE